jgi:EAL domain-containing protein (putative c-di-GMP-specific phosphodiesterase class I)
MPAIQAGAELAAKLNGVLSQPFDIGGHEARISGSIGIAICPDDAIDSDQLLKKADLALYRAKADGKGKFHYFTEKLDSAAHQRNRDLAELRGALERNEFWIAYQPKVAFSIGETIEMEALLRCSNPLFSGYPVERIVDLAIESGLMKSLSFWVLRETCVQLSKWREEGLTDLTVCVNMCAHELRDQELPEHIDALLWEMELAPTNPEVEITERQALDIEKYGLSILNSLRSRGIRIALDDFGTGYSALSYLRNLPVNAVKLDKSLLIGIPHDAQGRAVIKAVVDISHALGLETIAEGVETEAQAAFLRQNNCTGLQGFLVSHPLSAGDMASWLRGNNGIRH